MRTPCLPPILAACIAWASGCADPQTNAILEVELALPPNPEIEDTHAVLEVRPGTADFTPLWSSEDRAASFALPREPSVGTVSIVSGRELEALSMKIRFCSDAECAIEPDAPWPELHARLERPFHLGEYSRVRIEVDSIDWASITIGACFIEACAEVPMSSYCDDTGRHLCD